MGQQSSSMQSPSKSAKEAKDIPALSPADRLAFSPTALHKGLQNLTGENNCFLNVTIQALWHLGPFRIELQKLVESDSSQRSGDFINAICNLFIQYEFTELSVLPPTELRNMLSNLSDRFQLGSIVDSNEALDAILDKIHSECCPACPGPPKCLSHLVFGGLIMEQSFCTLCRATSEPILRSAYVHCVYAAELIEAAHRKETELQEAQKKVGKASKSSLIRHNFGSLLHKCMDVGLRECPSRMMNKSRPPACGGKATVKTFCLEAPLALAISVGWTQARESQDMIKEFLSLVSYTVSLSDVFFLAGEGGASTTQSSYVFRGMVCYYGMHYVSIFQEYCPGEPRFLLFDDSNIRPLGSWADVKEECVKAMYQPVLLLYELENNKGPQLFWEDLFTSDSKANPRSASSTGTRATTITPESPGKDASIDTAEMLPLIAVVDVFENERFSLLSSSWSWTHLMRHPRYTDYTGKKKFAFTSLDEARPPNGYEWDNSWALDRTYTNMDIDGWSYAVSYGYLILNCARGKSCDRSETGQHSRRRKWHRRARLLTARHSLVGEAAPCEAPLVASSRNASSDDKVANMSPNSLSSSSPSPSPSSSFRSASRHVAATSAPAAAEAKIDAESLPRQLSRTNSAKYAELYEEQDALARQALMLEHYSQPPPRPLSATSESSSRPHSIIPAVVGGSTAGSTARTTARTTAGATVVGASAGGKVLGVSRSGLGPSRTTFVPVVAAAGPSGIVVSVSSPSSTLAQLTDPTAARSPPPLTSPQTSRISTVSATPSTTGSSSDIYRRTTTASGPSLASLSGDFQETRFSNSPAAVTPTGWDSNSGTGGTSLGQEITVWGRRPVTISVRLEPVKYGEEQLFGFRPAIESSPPSLVVQEFLRHPKTKEILPAENSGRIALGDRIIGVEEYHLDGHTFTNVDQFVALLSNVSATSSSPDSAVSITVQSPSLYFLWFECPHCRTEVLAGEAVNEALLAVKGEPVSITCFRCQRNSIGRDMIPGVTL